MERRRSKLVASRKPGPIDEPMGLSDMCDSAAFVENNIREDVVTAKHKIEVEEPRLRWRKLGGGSHNHRDGQVVRRGEILVATQLEIEPFKNLFTPLDPLPELTPNEEEPTKRLSIVHKGGGKYNVINVNTGKPINDTLLTKGQAEGLITDE